MRASVRLSEGGRVVVPASMRKALHLCEGDILDLSLGEDGLLTVTSRRAALRRVQDRVRSLPGYDPNESWADELIAERREEARRESED